MESGPVNDEFKQYLYFVAVLAFLACMIVIFPLM